jgi:hypothetical protein
MGTARPPAPTPVVGGDGDGNGGDPAGYTPTTGAFGNTRTVSARCNSVRLAGVGPNDCGCVGGMASTSITECEV